MIEYDNRSGEELHERIYDIIGLAVSEALEAEGYAEGYDVSVSFVTSAEIQALNKRYRRIDRVTDVLSFPSGESRFLGDIIISVEKAREQARELSHSLEREIGFLAVHSALHLVGYDHMTPEDEDVMIKKQEAALLLAGLQRGL